MRDNIKINKFIGISKKDFSRFLKSLSTVPNRSIFIYIVAGKRDYDLAVDFEQKAQKDFKEAFVKISCLSQDASNIKVFVYQYTDKHLEKEEVSQEILRRSSSLLYDLSLQNIDLKKRIEKDEVFLLKKHFNVDFLTGLPNLYSLRSDLEEKNDCSLVIINIDNFKIINNFYGYIAGDYILEKMAKKLTELFGDSRVYRVSGDEYAIIIDHRMNFYELKEYLNFYSAKLKDLRFIYAGMDIFVNCTLASSASNSFYDIFSKVNMALMYAKEASLAFWIYEDSVNIEKEYETNLKVAKKIRGAIERAGIVPYFQPIACTKTGKVKKFECLARLIDEEGDIISPYDFVPISKKIKMYGLVTKMIIEKSFDAFRDIDCEFSVNLSMDDILNNQIYNLTFAP